MLEIEFVLLFIFLCYHLLSLVVGVDDGKEL